MDVKAVLHNLVTIGPRETLAHRRENVATRKSQREHEDEIAVLVGELLGFLDGAPYFERLAPDDYASLMQEIKQREDRLAQIDKPRHKEHVARTKARYLKELSGKLYAKWSESPVEDKVVFMEKDGARTQPNGYLSDRLKEEGKYQVVMIGLHRGILSTIEVYENVLQAIKESATAKAIFISSANNVFSQFDLRPETKLIQLWHGLGIYKKVGYSTLESGRFGISEEEREEYPQFRNYTYVTIPSEEQAWVFEDAMRIPVDSGVYAPIGVARTDVFFQEWRREKALEKLNEALPATRGKKIILYAPTYRGRVSKATGPDQMDIALMAEKLGDEYVLLVKHHGFAKNVKPIPDPYRDTFAFDMLEHAILSIDMLLYVSDICITDYSSIGFEYAILERPLIFFAYDLEDYIDNRGMYYDYDEVTPGPICKTTEEIVDYVQNLDTRFDREEIRAFREKFVGACDGHSAERTIALIDA